MSARRSLEWILVPARSAGMRLLALLGLLLPCVACDQAAKALAVSHLKGQGTFHVVDGLFRLTYAENPGAFLGLGHALPDVLRTAMFAVGVALVLGVLAFVLVKRNTAPAMFLGLALIVAGGVGNLVDRVLRPGRRVVDFAVLGIGPVHTGVFNVADVQIMAGAAMVAFGSMRRKSSSSEAPTSTSTA